MLKNCLKFHNHSSPHSKVPSNKKKIQDKKLKGQKKALKMNEWSNHNNNIQREVFVKTRNISHDKHWWIGRHRLIGGQQQRIVIKASRRAMTTTIHQRGCVSHSQAIKRYLMITFFGVCNKYHQFKVSKMWPCMRARWSDKDQKWHDFEISSSTRSKCVESGKTTNHYECDRRQKRERETRQNSSCHT